MLRRLRKNRIPAHTWLALATTVLASTAARAQEVRLVGDGEPWAWHIGYNEPPGAPEEWTRETFDDSSWRAGVPPFGSGTDEITTRIPVHEAHVTSLYIRRTFRIEAPWTLRGETPILGSEPDPALRLEGSFVDPHPPGPYRARVIAPGGLGAALGGIHLTGHELLDPPVLTHLFLRVDYEGGFVAFLNGVEVARRALGASGTQVPHDTLAGAHTEQVEEMIEITPFLGLLKPGLNVLALQGCRSTRDPAAVYVLDADLFATGPVMVMRYPYLARPTADSVNISWKTAEASIGSVLWDENRAVSEKEPGREHSVTLHGLAPDTKHSYVVRDNGRPITRIEEFQTLPGPGSPRIEFNVVGDSGVDRRSSRSVRSRWIATGSLFGLRVGDIANPHGDEWELNSKYFAVYKDFLRWGFDMVCIGNHDAMTRHAAPYVSTFTLPQDYHSGTNRYYAFEAGPALFVALDDFSSPYGPDSRQIAWLEKTLAASTQPWKFAYMHKGPFSSGSKHGGDPLARTIVAPIFERYGVDMVFSGHDHNYERTKPILESGPSGHPVVYVISGGGGAILHPWKGGSEWTATGRSTFEVVNILIDGRCLTLSALLPDGTVFDSYRDCK
jgi:hypothetical protein